MFFRRQAFAALDNRAIYSLLLLPNPGVIEASTSDQPLLLRAAHLEKLNIKVPSALCSLNQHIHGVFCLSSWTFSLIKFIFT